jgi:1-acylglycerone phosphate reductase
VYETPSIEADSARVRKMFDTNVFGVFDMVNAFIPLLLASVDSPSRPPTIINTASILGRLPYPFAAGYNATKAAVTSYSDTLRIELAPLGIKVVTLFMGEVSTGLMSADNISFGQDSLYFDVEEAVRERSRQHAPKSMAPEDFARQVVSGVLLQPAVGKGEYLWKGTNASTVWLLGSIGWRKIFDGTVKSAVGLDKDGTQKAIFNKGQRSIQHV